MFVTCALSVAYNIANMKRGANWKLSTEINKDRPDHWEPDRLMHS